MNFKRLLFLGLILFLVLIQWGCATFPKNSSNPTFLTEKNLTKLNGRYEIEDAEMSINPNIYYRRHRNFFSEMDWKIIGTPWKLDTINTYAFDIKVIDVKKIEVSYLENGEEIKKRTMKGKLKKDGYFYLKNKNFRFWGIPYVMGLIDIKKIRLSKSINDHLVFDTASHESGVFFIMLAPIWSNTNQRNIYRRIE